jgi:cytochrome c oxidase assembly factor CtaG
MRKLIALVLTCMMLLSFAACTPTAQEPAAEATESAAAPAEAAEALKQPPANRFRSRSGTGRIPRNSLL